MSSDEEIITRMVTEQATKAVEEKVKQEIEAAKPATSMTVDFSHMVSKQDFDAKIAEIQAKYDADLKEAKDLLLKVKAQGKAHIEEKEANPNAEIEAIYGKNFKMFQK